MQIKDLDLEQPKEAFSRLLYLDRVVALGPFQGFLVLFALG